MRICQRLLFLDRPGVGSGGFVRHGVARRGCGSVVSLVVFTVAGGRAGGRGGGRAGGRGLRFGFVLEPHSGTVQTLAPADAVGARWCRGRRHCKGKGAGILLIEFTQIKLSRQGCALPTALEPAN